ncbi:MAG TPA: hypothetical protein VK698_39475 [Kofleriaceae bacterium]|nr:hypothetical protein [Kofleriaceae bacterium]
MTDQPTSDPITALLAHLEAEQAKAQRTADEAGRRPADDLTAVEALYAAGGMACGFRQAAVLAVHHLRGPEARDAYIAATEGQQAVGTDATPVGRCVSSHCVEGDHIFMSPEETPATSTDTPDTCCSCGGTPVVYRNYRDLSFCAHCANCACGERPCVRATDIAGDDSELAQLRAELARMQEAGDHHLGGAERERADVQRDRDQHAAVLTDVLGRFSRDANEEGAAGYQCLLTVPGPIFERWRSMVAPTVERPWWEQVRQYEQAAVDATRHVLELKAIINAVRAALDGDPK